MHFITPYLLSGSYTYRLPLYSITVSTLPLRLVTNTLLPLCDMFIDSIIVLNFGIVIVCCLFKACFSCFLASWYFMDLTILQSPQHFSWYSFRSSCVFWVISAFHPSFSCRCCHKSNIFF